MFRRAKSRQYCVSLGWNVTNDTRALVYLEMRERAQVHGWDGRQEWANSMGVASGDTKS
jgi:hypothetical protein